MPNKNAVDQFVLRGSIDGLPKKKEKKWRRQKAAFLWFEIVVKPVIFRHTNDCEVFEALLVDMEHDLWRFENKTFLLTINKLPCILAPIMQFIRNNWRAASERGARDRRARARLHYWRLAMGVLRSSVSLSKSQYIRATVHKIHCTK